MKQLFYISHQDDFSPPFTLSLRVSERYAGFVITGDCGRMVKELGYFSSSGWTDTELTELFSIYPSLQLDFERVNIAYDFSESLMLPENVEVPSPAALLQTTGLINPVTIAVAEPVTGWPLKNIYSVPAGIVDWINNKFPQANHYHHSAIWLRSVDSFPSEGLILLDFRPDQFDMLILKEKQLLFTRRYEYATSADVLYYVLQAVQHYQFSQETVMVRLSGLIDQQSSLYQEIYHYFIEIAFREPEWTLRSEFAPHYFTTLNDLAKCE